MRVASTRSRFSVALAKLEAWVSLRWGADAAAGAVEEFGTVASALIAGKKAIAAAVVAAIAFLKRVFGKKPVATDNPPPATTE